MLWFCPQHAQYDAQYEETHLERAGLARNSQSSATASAARCGCSAFRMWVLHREKGQHMSEDEL